jgi:hypothetical protein
MSAFKVVAIIGGASLGLLLLSRKSRAMGDAYERHLYGAPMRLSRNFDLSEFLHSKTLPALSLYKLTPSELMNAKALVDEVLQPLRDKVGPYAITGGGRPPSLLNKDGKDITQLMLDSGDTNTSRTSDHRYFAGVDIAFPNQGIYGPAYLWLAANQHVRQVGIYQRGELFSHVHVSVIFPGHPRIEGPRFSYKMVEV